MEGRKRGRREAEKRDKEGQRTVDTVHYCKAHSPQ